MDRRKKNESKYAWRKRHFAYWEMVGFNYVTYTIIGIPITLLLNTPYAKKYKEYLKSHFKSGR